MSSRNPVRCASAATPLLLLVLGGCRPSSKVEIQMQATSVLLPPVVSSVRVLDPAGRDLAQGSEVWAGDRLQVEVHGSPGATAKVLGFGEAIALGDAGGGVYEGTVVVRGADGRREELQTWLEDARSEPPRGEAVRTALVVRQRVLAEPVPPWKEVQALLDGTRVHFDYDSTRPEPGADAVLRRWLQVMRDADSVVNFRVDGYCDLRGETSYNHRLGLLRATEVRKALIALGADSQRVGLTSLGNDRAEDCKIYTEADRRESCYAKDRRVELTVVPAR